MLSAGDYRNGLQLLHQLTEASLEEGAFARRGVELLARLVPSEVTTLSVCHLAGGRREVVGTPERAIGAEDRACARPLLPLSSRHGEGRLRVDAPRVGG